ncbi:C-type lectin domain family 4 member E-like [Lissotriton helveticus]
MESDVTYVDLKFNSDVERTAKPKSGARTDSRAQGENKNSPKILVALLLVIVLLLAGLIALIALYFKASSRLPELEHQMAQLQLNQTKVLKYIGCKNRSSAPNCSQFFYKDCPINWQLHNEKCFFFSQTPLSREVSRSICQSSQADLVIIADREEQLFIRNAKKDGLYWIGLTDKDEEGAWKWVNSSKVQPKTFWNCKQPDNSRGMEHCATVGSNDECEYLRDWNDDNCEKEHNFICEKEAEDRKMDFIPLNTEPDNGSLLI